MNALSSIGGHIDIQENPAFANIEGVSSLVSIGEFLEIQNNDALVSFDGMNVLSGVQYLDVRSNDTMENFYGLRRIKLPHAGGHISAYP
eukprot:m.9940 g.9940  ORF g.9940 m.9940 type:complete len:89 (-) comp7092_c0_seq1:412-678(-)